MFVPYGENNNTLYCPPTQPVSLASKTVPGNCKAVVLCCVCGVWGCAVGAAVGIMT